MILLATQLAASVALLLWSVRLIRTGVERAFLSELRRALKRVSRHPVSAAAGGGIAAMVLQSSTAVALIGGGFAASGLLLPAAALAMLLGADLGSALMARLLLLPVDDIVPFVLLTGVLIFFNARSRKAKQIGRIVIGIALVLVGLGMIRAATAPIGDNAIVQAIAAYFTRDLASAFVIGAILAWVMHSSLAAVLMFSTFAATGVVAVPVAAALVIGANIGGAVVPLLLLSAAPRPTRLVVTANLMGRAAVTFAGLIALLFGALDLQVLGPTPGSQVVMLHIVMNAALLCVGLPLRAVLVGVADRVLPKIPESTLDSVSVLDQGVLDRPKLALACAHRELIRMAETVQSMLVPLIGLFREWDTLTADAIQEREDQVDRMQYETKLYVSRLSESGMSAEQARDAVELVAMANSLEEAGDRIAVDLFGLARKMNSEALSFSDEGLADIERFHDQVVTNTQLALSVLTTGDAEAARQLVAEKDRIRAEERLLQERHLQRLHQRTAASVETTNIHQETLRFLKQVNAAISYVAYPIASQSGDLLDSRLAKPELAEGMP